MSLPEENAINIQADSAGSKEISAEGGASGAPGSANLKIEATVAPQVNFACHQNSVPVIRDIEIVNDSDRSFQDLTLQMIASPGFVAAKQWSVTQLRPGDLLQISDRDTRLDGQYLLDLRERQQGEIIFRLNDHDGTLLAEQYHPVEVLARNEWGGYGSSPELLAAFCMPNEPAVEKVLRGASDILRKSGEDGTLHPYENASPERIWLQASAIWSAVAALKLDYAYPPRSFESSGQKIRTPNEIVESRRATCLDTTMLLVALLEQVGLHPLVVLDQGHAYAAVWMKDEGFTQPYTEDLLALRKRVHLKEILVLETTLLCQNSSFSAAARYAEEHLNQSEDDFIGVVDIRRARDQRISPLSFVAPSEQALSDADAIDATAAAPALEKPPENAFQSVVTDWAAPESLVGGRLAQWQRRLLDLTLRNPLLKMRTTKTNIRLVAPDPGRLEDLLAQGKKFSIVSAPGSGDRDAKLHSQRTGTSLDDETALAALSRSTLFVEEEKDKLEAALVELYRKARNDLEEGGSNTLFLAIGVLNWQRPGAPGRTYRAPLILIPVTITRQSVRSGIKIALSDDEPRFNTTLLEMLRQDFRLDIRDLDGELPTDGSGTDISAIMTRMRQEVRDVSGFEVREEVWLGTFSFAKYLMWKDLVDRTDQLKQNPVVKHLIENPRAPFQSDHEFVDPASLDSSVLPEELFTPLETDSSQLAAVVAAARGKSFVMIGPPGTGKSQTISNMIVHNLGLGRTVLFVSEKSAALNVVYRRLCQHGLGEFCLELHSNKARKLDVIRQLGQAWDVRGDMSEDEWDDKTSRLRRVRDDLNQFVKALHHVHGNGLSVRHAISIAAGNPDVHQVRVSWAEPASHDAGFMERLASIGERLELNAEQVGDVSSHPLKMIYHADWSMAWQENIVERAADVSEKAAAYRTAVDQFAAQVGLSGSNANPNRLAGLSTLAAVMMQCAGKDLRFAFAPNAADIITQVPEANQRITAFRAQEAALSSSYAREKALAGNLAEPQQLWDRAKNAWWLPRFLGQRKTRAMLVTHFGASGKPDPDQDFPALAQMQALNRELDAMDAVVAQVPGWRGLDSDAASMTAMADLAAKLRSAIAALSHTPDELISVRGAVEKLVVGGNELLHQNAAVGAQLAAFVRSEADFRTALSHFAETAGRTPEDLMANPAALDGLCSAGRTVADSKHRLNAWCAWRRVRAEAVNAGLMPIVTDIENGTLPLAGISKVGEVNYCRWWARQMFDASPVLRTFVSVEHERKIQNFKQLDTDVRKITSEYIRTRIRAGLAAKEDVKRSSEYGIIRRELEKKTRHKPLRQLIREAPTAIPTLTPCLLMSPLSIAQYLPVDQKPFDVVIFDEASQITVWDAIGALARGKQSIVVGDPKQLPPTSFFDASQSADDDDDDLDVVEDLESILDEMLGSNLPVVNLAWHYRSRHESLITFSNQRYYNNGLITFPSPVTMDRAVSLEFVGGTYDRGGSQTNRAEAEAIVEEIKRRLTSPETCDQTLGVVTFNQKQQTLILNLLEKVREKNLELEKFFAEDLIEPVFVKNLEAVQGDERDVILFSTTFGPDKTGRISMNFGPLNNSGGERRLNVAITRARTELKVMTSLRPDQIDLSRTAALGVRDLKHFLEFAERGPRALNEAIYGSQGDFESPLEAGVAAHLRALGWIVQPQIGVSQFRVDLGIVDPDAPGSYLAGIECDGATYHRSATARDRDLVRESVLRGLGWEILRLWSTDYWINPQGVIKEMHEELNQLLEARRATRAATSQTTGD